MATSREDKVYDEFVKAVHDSHGRANNNLIYDLIDDYGCTAEDVALVAMKTKNGDKIQDLGRYKHNNKAVKRLVNKMIYSNKTTRTHWMLYTFGDLNWYFKYLPDEAKQLPILMNEIDVKALFGNLNNRLSDSTLSLYCYNYAVTLLERDNYPSKLFYDRFKGTKAYHDFVTPYEYKDLCVTYDGSQVWCDNLGRYERSGLNWYMNGYVYDYDLPDGTYITKTNQTYLAEQATQLDILCSVMMNEIYTEEELKNGRDSEDSAIHSYFEFMISHARKTGARKRNYPQTTRVELFSQAKTLEMLLGMGLGIKCKTHSDGSFRVSNKKLNKRIQTAYKTFIKAKTVDERKARRTLLKDQANILINDFMGGKSYFECVELNSVEEQDKEFEKNLASARVVRTKKKTSSQAPKRRVKYVASNVSLDALAKAKTVALTKGKD